MANDFTNGVWRTVGGRRIFIRDGEGLSNAMKRSGKFKMHKKKDDEYELYKRAKENPDSIDAMTENSTDWEKLEEKYKDRYDTEKLDREYDKAHGVYRKQEEEQKERLKREHREAIARENEERMEKMVEKYENRFAERVKSETNGKEKLDDKTTDRIFGGNKENFEKWKEQNNGKIASYYTDTYSKDLKNINERVWDNIAKDIYDEENEPRKINEQAFRNAYNDYKKKHPNSKVSFEQFKDWTEGK